MPGAADAAYADQKELHESVQLAEAMARKAAQPPQPPPTLTEPRAQVEAELDDRIAAGDELLKDAQSLTPYTSAEAIKKIADEYHTWDEYNRRLLKARFTTEEVANEYMPAMYVGGADSLHLSTNMSRQPRRSVNVGLRQGPRSPTYLDRVT